MKEGKTGREREGPEGLQYTWCTMHNAQCNLYLVFAWALNCLENVEIIDVPVCVSLSGSQK